jgi:hypothetical protein
MAQLAALEEASSEKEERQPGSKIRSLLPPSAREGLPQRAPHGIETLLTTKEASQILKIHPKVLERMAKRGRARDECRQVLALSRHDAGRLDQFKTTIRSPTVPHETSF